MSLVFWLLLCDPYGVDCSVIARVRHEDYAHDMAECVSRETPGCVMVTKRGQIEGLYGQCEEIYE